MKLLDFNKAFKNEEFCKQNIQLREKKSVVCKACGGNHQYWKQHNTCWIRAKCYHRTTLAVDTLFHESKPALLYWFMTIHLLTSIKKTFSASKIQCQLGYKHYHPIWEMVHKIRSIDNTYQLSRSIELEEGYFTSKNPDKTQSEKPLKRGVDSQRKSKALVMVESKETIPIKKSLILDMYHGIKDEILQAYLNEFYYKFNRRNFGDKIFDRLMVASVSYRPTFKHRTYGMKIANNHLNLVINL